MPSVQRTRVLIAEDSRAVALVLQRSLESTGFAVAVARDGREALDRFRADPADVMITDLQMPEMGGDALIRVIREDLNDAETPIIVCTGKDDPERIAYCQDLGVVSIFCKPISPTQLCRRVQELSRGER